MSRLKSGSLRQRQAFAAGVALVLLAALLWSPMAAATPAQPISDSPASLAAPMANQTGGPDAFGYTYDDNLNHPQRRCNRFIDISATGTKLAKGGLEVAGMAGGNLDDGFWEVTFPFPFDFYGNNVAGAPLYVGTNGFVTFDSIGATSLGGNIPDPTPPNGAVFGFWDDLRLDATTTGVDCGTDIDCGLYIKVIGAAPSRRFIIQYNQVPFFDQNPDEGHVRFQISFMEHSGEIKVDYALELGACAADGCQRVGGGGASIGIESDDPANGSGTPFTGLAYSQDTVSLLVAPGSSVQTIRFHHPAAPPETCGPDAFGYTFDDNVDHPAHGNLYTDISATGTKLAKGGVAVTPMQGGNLDDGFWEVTFPFPFDFYGNNVSGAPLYVGTNGLVSFDSAGATSLGGNIPDNTPPNAGVFGLWDDLRLDATTTGVKCGVDIDCGLYTQVVGSAPNRRFVIQYNQVPFFNQDPDEGRVRFEVSFMEATGDIRVDYALELGPCAPSGCDRVTGGNAELGLESFDPANSFGTPFTGLVYSQDEPFLRVTPTSTVQSIVYHASTVDLVVTKSESADPVVAGSGAGNLTYVITVTNAGPGPAFGVALSELITLPAGVSIASITPASGTSYNPPNAPSGTWTVGNLALNASRVMTVVLTVGASAAAGTDVVGDTASVATVAQTRVNLANDSATVLTSVVRQADLHVSKTESIDPVVAGSGAGNLTYVVTLSNTGVSDASNVTVSELVTTPSGVTINSITPQAGSSYAPSNASGTWTIAGLPVGGTKLLTVVLTAGAGAAGGVDVIGDTATVTGLAAGESRVNMGDDSATQRTSVVSRVDLTMAKYESADPVVAGTNLTYTVVITNNGPATATNVTVTESVSLPSGATISVITPQAGTTYAPANSSPGVWNIPSIAVGASKTLTVVIAVASSASEGADVIADTATVGGASNVIVSPGDDSASASTSIVRRVDLRLTKTESVDPVVAGSGSGNLVYVVTLQNLGPSDATGITASEVVTYPAHVTLDSIAPQSGTSYAPANLSPGTWTVGSLAAGASAKLTVTLTAGASAVTATGVIADTADVAAVSETRINTADDSVTVATSITRNSDLMVTKSESADPVVAGSGSGNLTYVVTVTNIGPSDASGIALSEVITTPSGTSIASITAGGGTSYAPANTSPGMWTVGALPAGQSRTLTVVLTIGASTAAGTNTVGDTASVSSANETRVNTTNDSVTERTSVTRQVDLVVVKTESTDTVVSGTGPGNLTYVITVTNAGPSDASGVAVSEVITVPAGVTIDSITPQAPTTYAPANSSPGTWTVGNLAVGTSKRLTVVLTVGPAAPPGIDNIGDTATVTTCNEPRINTGDDSATERSSVQPVTIQLSKLDSPDPVRAGDVLTYTLVFTNASPIALANPRITDTIPTTHVTFNSVVAAPGWSCAGTATVVCTTPSMPAFSTVTNVIRVNVSSSAPANYRINNTATANSGTGNRPASATTQTTVYRSR